MQQEVAQNQMYAFDPYYGFVPVAKKEEAMAESEEVVAEVMAKKEEAMAEEVVAEMVADQETEVKMEAAEEAADDSTKFYFHPYFGFVPSKLMSDEKLRKGVNMDMKYILHPYFGFVPESKTADLKSKPYNPFGYKFVPYQPMAYNVMYNNVGGQVQIL
jgi:hypothetical protein